jgi:hypothetical protein
VVGGLLFVVSVIKQNVLSSLSLCIRRFYVPDASAIMIRLLELYPEPVEGTLVRLGIPFSKETQPQTINYKRQTHSIFAAYARIVI